MQSGHLFVEAIGWPLDWRVAVAWHMHCIHLLKRFHHFSFFCIAYVSDTQIHVLSKEIPRLICERIFSDLVFSVVDKIHRLNCKAFHPDTGEIYPPPSQLVLYDGKQMIQTTDTSIRANKVKTDYMNLCTKPKPSVI